MSGETHLDFTTSTDGHDTAVAGNPGFDQVELKRISKRESQVTEKKAGAVVGTIREKLSNDKNQLTITTARSGKPPQTTVWLRTGPGKVDKDPVAGEWTEDLSKTRLAQGGMLKIEPDGSGGVRFTGEFSYSARFDGKPYDLKNSRNDSVMLEQVDTHTVASSYRRDDQVVEKDRWVVAGDGQQMTRTDSGTLETGQRITEKLVYKKQP